MMIIEGKTYSKPLFVFAMESEAGAKFDDVQTVFTGLGKVNAGYRLMKSIADSNPDLIINMGTAGSNSFNRGDVVCCTGFIQRDMNVSALGFNVFQTPFESMPVILKNGIQLSGFPEGTCGSGDNFEVGHNSDAYNVIDMEAYALAKIAFLENIPFMCLKYITDGADDDAAADWNDSIQHASEKLRASVEKLF